MSEPGANGRGDTLLPRDWPALSPLVDVLLDVSLERRASMLAELSGGDPDRRALLERLVAECERDVPLLNRPAAERFDRLVGEEEGRALPETVGARYRVGDEVGRGGMARVYRARDLKHDRDVAIKVVRSGLVASLGRDRFLGEIAIAARLRHPNILPLYDSGEANGALYFVMPFESGPTLRQRLTSTGPFPLAEALSVLRDVARALQYAHAQGVVHRDIKPDNVLMSGGAAVVADFGIAKAFVVAQTEATNESTPLAGAAIGTPAYMAPEPAAGDPSADHRADIYSFGCLAYELYCGCPPFHDLPAHQLIAAHVGTPPRPLRELRPEVPAGIADLIARCLEKIPAARPQSASEVLAALESAGAAESWDRAGESQRASANALRGAALRDEDVADRSLSVVRTFPATEHRSRRIAVAAFLSVLTLAVVTVALTWRSAKTSEPFTRIERLAVLPLVNATGDTAVSAVAEALTQELIASLLSAGVRVLGYNSVAKYKGTGLPLKQVGKELDVDAVAAWVVRRQGTQLQVTLEVLFPQSGEGVWASKRYTVDALLLPDVAAGTARELASHFAASRASSRSAPRNFAPTASPDAKIAYLRGMQRTYLGALGFEDARVHFQRAIQLDSTFAPAWAAIGYTSTYAIDYAILPRREACARARPAIQRALALDPDLALAHLARARMLQHCDWNWREAEAEYRTAISLEPSAIAYAAYGWLLEWYLGRTREGVAMGDTAVALEPDSWISHMALAWRLSGARELDRAEDEARIALALQPNSVDGPWILAEVSLQRKDFATAERELSEQRRLGGTLASMSALGELYARTGRVGEARAYLRELTQERPLSGPSRVALARTQMALGERDAALTTLELAVRDSIFIIPFQPFWDPIRGDARFHALVRKMGF